MWVKGCVGDLRIILKAYTCIRKDLVDDVLVNT